MTFKGKGSKQRPYNRDKFNDNFDKIFRKPNRSRKKDGIKRQNPNKR